MASLNAPAQNALADIFLARIPLIERTNAIRDLAEQVNNDTIDLVATLTSEVPDVQAENQLQSYLVRSIESGDPSVAATVCLRYPHIGQAFLQRVEEELNIAFRYPLEEPSVDSFVVSSSHVARIKAHSPEIQREARDPGNVLGLAVVYLNFVRQISRSSASVGSLVIPQTLVSTLLALLLVLDQKVAYAAKDACFAFLSAYNKKAVRISGLDTNSTILDDHFWQCIRSLLESPAYKVHRTTGYALWLRWLNIPEHSGAFTAAIQSDSYWNLILDALTRGDVEQRKTCLHILRASLAVSKDSINTRNMILTPTERNNNIQAQYGRYCTVYETVIIGRYFNQIEECLGDLDFLASSQTEVQKAWLFALLEPALSTALQDSVRRMLGNWLMSTDLNVSTHINEFCGLLRTSFLPWACQGQLFTGSLKGQTKNMQCEHGTILASFVERLLKAHSVDDQVDVRSSITLTILDFLHTNKTRIIPYSVLYLLHGLARGLGDQNIPCMNTSELKLLLDLATGTAYAEIARDVFQSCCLNLSLLTSGATSDLDAGSGTEELDLRLKVLTQRVEQIRLRTHTDHVITASRWHSIENYLEELHASRHTCITGDGLYPACRGLIKLLDTSDTESINPDHLYEVLESIWTEMEIQDYSKNILLLLPGLVLHPTCVASSLPNEALAGLISSYMFQLHEFSSGKIYLLSPLMKALRVALLAVPTSASKLAVADLIVKTANKPPSSRLEFQLEAAIVHLLPQSQDGARSYTDYYGEYEEEGYAAFFDLVNRLPAIDDELAREVYDQLMSPWAEQTPPVPVVNKLKTTIQPQIMLILQEQLFSTMTPPQTQYHMDILHRILAIEPLPRYRLLIEWMIARTIIRHPGASGDILVRLSTMDHHSNPKYLSSLAKIALMIACLDDSAEDFVDRLACRLVALSSSSKIIIRHEAQWSFPILWDVSKTRKMTSITNNIACQALNEYIRSLQGYSTPPLERQLGFLDPVTGHTIANLLQGKYLGIEPAISEIVSVADFEKLLESDRTNVHLPQILPSGCLPLGQASRDRVEKTDVLPAQATQEESKASARTVAVAALQTKGTAYLLADSTKNEETERPTDLIVVASLVDNAYNLGGLSRISEIFGASGLYMARPKAVLANKDFISVAVASQNHLPIHELSVDNLQAFLTEKKLQGYSVVGVEQTNRSVLLGSDAAKLPAKTLLVMGAEKEGIPAMVLGECDVLIEIPQRGVTRSMNVQTAAGVVLYEYSRQHRVR